jgi:hypothetical protein
MDVRVDEDPSLSERKLVAAWLDQVRSLYDLQTAPTLHGRLVVYGLSLLAPDIGRQFVEHGLIDALEAEIGGLDDLLIPSRHELRRRLSTLREVISEEISELPPEGSTGEDLDVSSSVTQVVEGLTRDEEVTAAVLLNGLLRLHSEYADGKAEDLEVKEDPSRDAKQPAQAWLSEVRSLLEEEGIQGTVFWTVDSIRV